MDSTGLHRRAAAAWITRRTGYRLTDMALLSWERSGLLPRQDPGRRRPARYGVGELVTAACIAELRRNGAPLQRVRKALAALRRLLPDIAARPGAWRLAVTSRGDVVHITREKDLLELTRRPGQYVSSVLDAGGYAEEARKAVTRAA